MHELRQAAPDPALIPLLQTEDLGAKVLFILRKRMDRDRQQSFLLGNELGTLWLPDRIESGLWTRVATELRQNVELALSEAWAWLTAQGLLVPAPGNAQSDWRVLSRRARAFESEANFASYATARLLPKEILVAQLAGRVWLAFMRGEFDSAVFYALKTVEVEVRSAAQLSSDLIGVRLMRKAFDPKEGPLTDMSSEDGEREARSSLFAGAIGSYKNPQSHRDVNLEDPAEAMEIIMLANHLLRIVEARRRAISVARL